VTLGSDDPVAVALIQAIRTGDIDALEHLLRQHPGLASARIQDSKGSSRTPLHVAADWPGYFPGGPAVVRLLAQAGADPSAPVIGAATRKRRCTGQPAATTSTSPTR